MKYLLLLLFFVTIVCGAGVYMQTDNNGNVAYSDSPSPDAKQVNVPAPSTIQTALPMTPPSKTSGKSDSMPLPPGGPTPHKPYTQFEIASPQDQQTFQNQRDIPIELNLAPRLQNNDSIQLYVDGAKYRDPWFTSHAEIYMLDRGTHTVYATLLDASGAPVKTSGTVTIYIHYAALGGGGGAPANAAGGS